MKRSELAQRLNGIDLSDPIPRDLLEQAKAGGLVIVHGSSDDLAEFRGAIHDEASIYGGGTVYFDGKGVLLDYDDIDRDDEAEMRNYFDRKRLATSLEAHWHNEPGASWTYTTAIPHSTFNMLDNGELYCKGIVFSLEDAGLHIHE